LAAKRVEVGEQHSDVDAVACPVIASREREHLPNEVCAAHGRTLDPDGQLAISFA